MLIRMKEHLLLVGPPHLRLFLRKTVIFVADPQNTRGENKAMMLSRYVQKTSRIKYKKPTKSGMMNGRKQSGGD